MPKIITGRFMDKPIFAYDEAGHYNNNANSFIAGAKPFLAGILNSSTSWCFLRNTCTDLQNGYLQAHNENIAAIPIPSVSDTDAAQIDTAVRRILRLSGDDPRLSELEAELNDRVYRLFDLTRAEIALVEEAG